MGGVDIPAGTLMMVLAGAVDRDPRRFENPHELRVHRRNVFNRMAFGRGVRPAEGPCFDACASWSGCLTSQLATSTTGRPPGAAAATGRRMSCEVSATCAPT